MNVSLADITSAYILVFGTTLDKHLPYSDAAQQIVAARKDWKRLMKAITAARASLTTDATPYPEYADVAARAKEMMTALEVAATDR